MSTPHNSANPGDISTPSLSYCLRLPVGGSVSVMRTTAFVNVEAWRKNENASSFDRLVKGALLTVRATSSLRNGRMQKVSSIAE